MLFRGVLVYSLGCHASLVGSNLSLFPFIYKSVLNYALNLAVRWPLQCEIQTRNLGGVLSLSDDIVLF